MRNEKHIVYLGCSGFPYGLAEVKKMTLISKGLVKKGNSVTIIANRGILDNKDLQLGATGNFEGIDYVYTSGSAFRHSGFIKRNISKAKGVINEYLLLRDFKKHNKLDYAILSTNSFFSVYYYYILSKILRFKTVLNYVEYYSSVKKEWFKIKLRINDKLFDAYAPKLVDFVFPISEFLIYHIKKIAPEKKYLKIPILTDFNESNVIESAGSQKYFLFCGALSYIEVIKFIIDSFCLLNNPSVFLYLVVNGNKERRNDLEAYLNTISQRNQIKLFSNLEEKELTSFYQNAMGLLIPLRPTLQDKARFPHKIGEYLASARPVISTNYGEVKYYFRDMQNMLIADSYDSKLFADKMHFVLNNPTEARKIGINGYNMAVQNFDCLSCGEKIINFFTETSLKGSRDYKMFEKVG